MATGKALNGKPYAGNPHVRFDEGEVAPAATPRRGSLLYKKLEEFTQPIRQDNLEDRISALKLQLAILEGKRAGKELSLASIWETFTTVEDLANVTETTLAGYKGNVSLMCDWMTRHGARNAEGVTIELAGQYLRELQASVVKNTYNIRLVLFKRVWKALVRNGYSVKADAWENYSKQKGVKHSSVRRALSNDEVKSLLTNAPTEDLRLLVTLGIYTGMRLSDCATLRWADVDMTTKTLHVTPIKTRRHGIKLHIPINAELYKELEAARNRSTGEYVSESNAHSYSTRRLTDKVSTLFHDCGIETSEIVDGKKKVLTGFHALRHTAASNLAKNGVPPTVIMQIMGWTSTAMLMRYVHTDEEQLREGMEALKVA